MTANAAQEQYTGDPPPPLAPPLTAGGEPDCDWWKCERGRGSLLFGAPESRGDGAERESLLLLLGELGQTLFLLLTDRQTTVHQDKEIPGRRRRVLGPSSYLRKLSLSALEGLDGVVLQSVVLQHRPHVVHSAQSDG